MRVLNWNIEHQNSWWTGGNNPQLRDSFAGNGFSPPISDVADLAARAANVITLVDPDVVTLQEAAGMPELVEFFGLVGGPWDILRGAGGTQALAVAVRSDRVDNLADGPVVIGGVDLSEDLEADVDADLLINTSPFAREPQVVQFRFAGEDVLLINNHLKSKFVRNAETLFNNGGTDRLTFFADALIARRRISAEAYKIRKYLDAAFGEDPGRHVIVTGDLNDGAGSDFFESTFLTHSVVDRIFGSVFFTDRQLRHVLFHNGTFDLARDFTAQFFDFIEGRVRDLVLDHIGLSPSLDARGWTGRVAIAEYDANTLDDATAAAREERDRQPSDHRPVVADLNI